MNTKRCSKCGKIKSKNEFHKNKTTKDGLNYWCKDCVKKYHKNWQKNNLEKVKEIHRKWRRNNPKEVKERSRKYRKNNPEKVKKSIRKWRENNPEYDKKYKKEYRKNNPEYKLSRNISSAIWSSLKGNKNNHWEDLVGFTLKELMKHLEVLFQPSMSWQNMGKWHIDHIKPISSFSFNSYNDPEFKECWALKNLQPLWAKENQSKGAKI